MNLKLLLRSRPRTNSLNGKRGVMPLIHKQGIYPSARQVFIVLNDPHILQTKEGHKA